jgi:lipoprotein-releasing system ATP-binding protein
MSKATSVVLACQGLSKKFGSGALEVKVFDSLDFTVYAGDTIAIEGASGAGKSTLLHCLGGLDVIDAGKVLVRDRDMLTMSERERCQWRNQYLGFVYQFHHLLPEFDALENVLMPLWVRGERGRKAKCKARELLVAVGLKDRLYHRLNELSGGERQRVAIARALVTEPACVLADEPTGNLDQATADQVTDLLLRLNRELGVALVVVTHNPQMAGLMQRRLRLDQGRLA